MGVFGAAGAWYLLQGERVTLTPATPTTVVLLPTRTSVPTRTPIFATMTPLPASPTPTITAELAIGREALVVTGGLRARREAQLAAPVVASFRQGDRVKIIEGPQGGRRLYLVEGREHQRKWVERSTFA